MNADKAKEFFSSYYEGTLERGLRQTFERRLESDAALRSEYDAFVRTVVALGSLSAEVPEPDFDLHERISARLDRHVWEQRRDAGASVFGWWKSLAVGGIAAAALFGALTQLNSRSGAGPGGIATASLMPNVAPGQLRVVINEKGVYELRYRSSGAQAVILSTVDGEALQSVRLNDNWLRSELINRLPKSALIRFEVDNQALMAWIAIPGTGMQSMREGKGTLKDFALAAATTFRVPVVLRVADADRRAEWSFDSLDEFETIQKAIEATGYAAERRPGGVIWVEGH